MMLPPELPLFFAFVIGLFVIEIWDAAHKQQTISEHVQGFFHTWPAIGFIAGAVVGWFGCHFFS